MNSLARTIGLRARRAGAASLVALTITACGAPEEPIDGHNTLTPDEEAAGWQLLFDGVSTDGWRGWNQDAFPETGWMVVDGDLVVLADGYKPSADFAQSIRESLRGQIAPYKIPHDVEFAESLPKSAVGKILRAGLIKPI